MNRQSGPSEETRALLSQAATDNPIVLSSPHPAPAPPPLKRKRASQPVSWSALPKKGQLAILVLARLAEPLSERSLTSYLFYQLAWFDPALDASEIVKQASYLTAIFAAAQCLTSMWWGYAADHARLGRKRVLIFGLVGSSISALGMGFATSLWQAFVFRFMAGALNGNVGVLRTMVSEVVEERKYQSRAFLLLPLCFNVGVIIGPLLSGFLADPIHAMPGVFGPGTLLGGQDGVDWMKRFPYSLPNLFFASVLTFAALCIVLGLDETHPQLKNRPDPGRRLGKFILRKIFNTAPSTDYAYQTLPSSDEVARDVPDDEERHPADTAAVSSLPSQKPQQPQGSRLQAILTKNVLLTMLQRLLQSMHVSAFNSMFFTLLPSPRADPSTFHPPFQFSGGLGLSSQKMGLANTIIGLIGLPLQLFVYPRVVTKLGVRDSYRVFLPLSIVAYCLLPWLILLPADNLGLLWVCLTFVLSMQVLSRTFVNPATIILVNDCAPRADLLGTIHGVAQSISSAARIVGPTVGGAMLGWGLGHNLVGLPLWVLTFVAMANWAILWWIDDVKDDE